MERAQRSRVLTRQRTPRLWKFVGTLATAGGLGADVKLPGAGLRVSSPRPKGRLGSCQIASMSYEVWISTEPQQPDTDPGDGGDGWIRIGLIQTSDAGGIKDAIRRHPDGRGVKGYVLGDMSAPWVAEMHRRYPLLKRGAGVGGSPERFWVAVAVGLSTSSTYYISSKPARFTPMGTNPPEQHISLHGNYKPVPLRLS